MLSATSDIEWAVCPYDNTHVMSRKRLQQHIIKCRIRHPNSGLQTCPFNSLHIISESEYQEHVINCADRKIIEEYKLIGGTEPVENAKHAYVESEENWDDADYKTYNPQEKLNSMTNVLIKPKGYTKSERRKYAKEQNLLKNNKTLDETSTEAATLVPPPPPIIKNWNINSTADYERDHHYKELDAAHRFFSSTETYFENYSKENNSTQENSTTFSDLHTYHSLYSSKCSNRSKGKKSNSPVYQFVEDERITNSPLSSPQPPFMPSWNISTSPKRHFDESNIKPFKSNLSSSTSRRNNSSKDRQHSARQHSYPY